MLSHDAGGPDYRHLAAAFCKHDPRSVSPNSERHFFELVWVGFFCWSNWDLNWDENPSSVRDNSIHSVQMILHPGTLNSVATTHGVASGPSRMNRMVRHGVKSHSWYQSAQFPSTMRCVCKIMSDCDVTSGVASPDTRSPYPSSATGAPSGPAAGRRC